MTLIKEVTLDLEHEAPEPYVYSSPSHHRWDNGSSIRNSFFLEQAKTNGEEVQVFNLGEHRESTSQRHSNTPQETGQDFFLRFFLSPFRARTQRGLGTHYRVVSSNVTIGGIGSTGETGSTSSHDHIFKERFLRCSSDSDITDPSVH